MEYSVVDILAADTQKTLSECAVPAHWELEVHTKARHTRHPEERAHTPGFGCPDVSPTSTGYCWEGTGTNSKFTQGVSEAVNVSKKDTEPFQSGDCSIFGKGENACSGRPVEVKKLSRMNRTTQRLTQVSRNVHNGMEKFTRRVEDALVKLTSRGYHQIPLEPVGEKHWKLQRGHWQSTNMLQEKSRHGLSHCKSRSCCGT